MGVESIDESILEVNKTVEITDFLRITRREDNSVIITFSIKEGSPKYIRVTRDGQILNKDGNEFLDIGISIRSIHKELRVFWVRETDRRELIKEISDWYGKEIIGLAL